MKGWPQKESDMGPPLIAWLRSQHWEVYQEVQPWSGWAIADIVATLGNLVWVIEMKKSLSLDLMAQAAGWRHNVHYISIAIPMSSRASSKGRYFAEGILRDKGIGLLSVTEDRVRCDVSPSLSRQAIFSKRVRDALCDEHKTFAKAGNDMGIYWTPFQQTCREVGLVVRESPGISAKDLIDQIKHHYASDQSARSSLLHWARAGVIKGVELRAKGHRLFFHPVPATKGGA